MNAIPLDRLPEDDPRVQRKLMKIDAAVDMALGPEGVEDELSLKQVHLEKLVSFHERKNPLISFLDYVGGDVRPETLAGLVPLVFKLADPGVKFLNDDLLGITDTDEFIADLQRLILSMCAQGEVRGPAKGLAASRNVMKVLSMGFKGGMGVFKGDIHERKDGNMSFAGKIQTFNHFMNDIFQVFLVQKLEEELEKSEPKQERVDAIANTLYEYGADQAEIADVLGQDEYEHPKGAAAPMSNLKLNFGFGQWPEVNPRRFGLRHVLMGLMHAEFNANMLKLRQKLDRNVIDIDTLSERYADLTAFFWDLSLSTDLENEALFVSRNGDKYNFLTPAVESAWMADGLEEEFPGLAPDVYDKIESYYSIRDQISEQQNPGTGKEGAYVRERYKQSSYEKSIAFQLIDFVRERKRVYQLWRRAQRKPELMVLFDETLALQGSFFTPAVIDAVRKGKLRERYAEIADEEVYQTIERFYLVVNVLDILKPYLQDHVDHYVDFQMGLYEQIKCARDLLLQADSVDVDELDEVRRLLADYAQISPKDEDLQFDVMPDQMGISKYRSKTHVGFMKAFLTEGSRTELKENLQLLEMDFIGFGALNFQALVTTMTSMAGKILNHLDADAADVLRERQGSGRDSLTTVQRAELIESALKKKPRVLNELWDELLSVADEANKMLSDARNHLGAMDCVEAVNVDGGDELEVLVDVTKADEADWNDLKDLAQVYALRVVPFTLSSVRTTHDLAQAVVAVEARFSDLKLEEKLASTGKPFVSTNFCPVQF